jgi:outer membrane protein assembly factor BamA
VKRLALVALVAACGGAPPPVEPAIPPEKKPAPPPVVEWSKLVGPITAVEVNTSDATLVPKVKDAVASVVGKPLDREALRAALDTALALPGVAEIGARATQLADGVQLLVDVTPQPTLHALVAREAGGKLLQLPGQLTSAIGLPVDPALLDALGVQYREQYLAQGYTDATVAWKQADAGKGAVDAIIEITPGKASTITAVDFKGNAHVKKADLVKAVGDGFAPNSPWNPEIVTRGSLLVTSYYYDHGYVNASVEEPPPPGQPGPVVYAITEGDQFRVGTLSVTNASAADAKKYLAMIGVKQGQIFNRSAIAEGIQKIEQSLKDSGQVVVPVTNVDSKKKVVDLEFKISKG